MKASFTSLLSVLGLAVLSTGVSATDLVCDMSSDAADCSVKGSAKDTITVICENNDLLPPSPSADTPQVVCPKAGPAAGVFVATCQSSELETPETFCTCTTDTTANDPTAAGGLKFTLPTSVSTTKLGSITCTDSPTDPTMRWVATLNVLKDGTSGALSSGYFTVSFLVTAAVLGIASL